MGYKIGIEIAEAPLSMTEKMSWHLRGNHYPPIDEAFIPAALAAIYSANTNNWDALINYPTGVQRTAAYTVESLHLEPFVPGMAVPEEEE